MLIQYIRRFKTIWHYKDIFLQLTNSEVDVALSSTEDNLRGSDGAAARRDDQTTCGVKDVTTRQILHASSLWRISVNWQVVDV